MHAKALVFNGLSFQLPSSLLLCFHVSKTNVENYMAIKLHSYWWLPCFHALKGMLASVLAWELAVSALGLFPSPHLSLSFSARCFTSRFLFKDKFMVASPCFVWLISDVLGYWCRCQGFTVSSRRVTSSSTESSSFLWIVCLKTSLLQRGFFLVSVPFCLAWGEKKETLLLLFYLFIFFRTWEFSRCSSL